MGTQSQFGKRGLGLEKRGADGDGGIGGLEGGGIPHARKLEPCTVSSSAPVPPIADCTGG